MKLRALVRELSGRLATASIEAAPSEAWLLAAAATRRDRAELMAGMLDALSQNQAATLERLVGRRLRREPLAYILGEKEFWSLRFEVGPGVLIPRPDTETVVEAALDQVADPTAPLRVLDLGTGSGCLLLALLSELPNATGLGVDASPDAVAVAGRNAARLGFAARAAFRLGTWGQGLDGPFDLIVGNPPYITEDEWPSLEPEIRAFEPEAALLAGPDGLDAYRALAPDGARLLAPGGILALEIGLGQGDAVREILGRHGLVVIDRYQDLAGIERCLIARHAGATP